MKSYQMNDGDRFYDHPLEREQIRNQHQHRLSCDKARKKRKKRKKK
ncbi:MAG: hypothetical protein ACOCVF_00785 [bacterium]